jgi:uncharacterized protein (DUF427 family)
MSDHIKLRKAPGTWVLRAGDAVLGETTAAIELSEGQRADVIYFPRADIATVFLEPSATRTTCTHKGEAEYFSIVTPSGTIRDAGWSYPNPPEALAAIAGHIAFATDLVTVEQL